MIDDLRFAIRSFARAKTTTAVLLVSLALGTGANAALYSLIRALLFGAPAGVDDPSRLARVFTAQFNGGERGFTSYPDYLSIKASSPSFETLAAFDDSRFETVRLDGALQRVRAVAASEEFFSALGLTPHAGRFLGAGDAESEKRPAVISFSLWTAFGRPSDAIGRAVRIGDRDYWIAGVAPPRFDGLQLGRAWDVWIPLAADTGKGRGDRRLSLIGRLARGSDVNRAQRDLDAVSTSLAERYPETNRGTRAGPDEPRRMAVFGYTRMDASERAQVVLISVVVLGATGLLLVSACVNAATLLLSRSAARRRELAVKVALGASRRLLARQALVEGFLISLAGAGLGLLVAHWTARALPALFAPEEAEMLDTSIGASVVLATAILALVAGALFAIGPARHATQTLDVEVLRADAGGVSENAGGAALRALVVTGQVAVSTVMLIAAGLLMQALSVALAGDLGPGGRGVGVTMLRLPGDIEDDVTRGILFHRRVLEDVRKIPGVEAAGWVATLPVGRSTALPFQVAVAPGLTETLEVEVNVASAQYFHTMRIAVVEGRSFSAEDGALAKPVVVVNDILARRYFGPSAVGRQLTGEEGTAYEVVGVVRTGKYRTFQEAPEPMVYFPITQRQVGWLHLVVRSGGRGGTAAAGHHRTTPVRRQRGRHPVDDDLRRSPGSGADARSRDDNGGRGLRTRRAADGDNRRLWSHRRRRPPPHAGDRTAPRARGEHAAGRAAGVQRRAAPDDGRGDDRCLRGARPGADRSGVRARPAAGGHCQPRGRPAGAAPRRHRRGGAPDQAGVAHQSDDCAAGRLLSPAPARRHDAIDVDGVTLAKGDSPLFGVTLGKGDSPLSVRPSGKGHARSARPSRRWSRASRHAGPGNGGG